MGPPAWLLAVMVAAVHHHDERPRPKSTPCPVPNLPRAVTSHRRPPRVRGVRFRACRRRRRSSRSAAARSRSPTRRRSTFPDAGYTKLDLVHYYLAVADGALTGIRGRPMALKRFVDGITKEPFFQKRAPDNTPDWIRTAELTFPSGRTADEIVVDDAAALAWIVNLGCIDLNPHPVRADDLDHPDELRVDLDPVPGVEWPQIREVALACREALEAVGLVGWPKTSGSRGIHINVRIARDWTYPEVRRAALALARDVERRVPRCRHVQVVEGGAPRRVPRLQPERQGPHGRLGVLRPAAARRPRLDAADLGRGADRRGRGVHDRDRAGALRLDRRSGRRHRRCGRLARRAAGAVAQARGRGRGRRPVAAELREAGRRAAARPAVTQAPAGLGVRAGSRRGRRSAAGGRRGTGGRRRGGRPERRPADRMGRLTPDADRPAQDQHPGHRDLARRLEGGGARRASSAGRPATRRPPMPWSPPTSSSTACAGARRSGTGSGST